MNDGIVSVIPIVVLIVGALITKKISEMMILASVVGAVLVYKGSFFTGYISMMYEVLSDPTYQFILLILVCLGALIRQFQESGALFGFRSWATKLSRGPINPLLLSLFLHLFLFIDDYLSTLAVSFAMRDTTDSYRIPREHLAFQVSSTCPSLSVLIPFTSWTAFTTGLLRGQGFGFRDYVQAIPMMYFPILMLLLIVLLSLGIFPKVGSLKRAYKRVREGGDVLLKDPGAISILDIDPCAETKESSAWNFVIPIIVLIITVFLYNNSMVHGLMAALVTQAFMYTGKKLMSAEEFMNNFFEGASSMTRIAIIIFFAYILNEANTQMGFSHYLIGLLGDSFPPYALPPLVFILIALSTFATSGYWVIQVITVPVFIPLALSMNVHPSLVIAAMMSGATFGSMFCFYSDVVFMAAAGTGVSNIRQIHVSAPYILSVAAITSILYLITGLVL